MQTHRFSVVLITVLLAGATAQGEEVEVYLTDMLDNTQNGYCLDIARAQGAQANPEDGLQGHTCYSPGGALGVDQTFDSDRFAEGVLYMPRFDVCAALASDAPGTGVDLATCDGSPAQNFVIEGAGSITPASAPDMCLTLGGETRGGRSDANQIKALSLQPCTAEQAAYQTWDTRGLAD